MTADPVVRQLLHAKTHVFSPSRAASEADKYNNVNLTKNLEAAEAP